MSTDRPPSGASTSWSAWWDTQDVLDDDGWRRDAEDFVAATDVLLHVGRDDDVLDVGCGPAFVLEAFARRGVRSAVGVDVAARLIESGRTRLAGHGVPPVELIALDRERPTDLASLGDRRFSVVVCNSVVQYLRDAAEAEALLRSMLRVCAPGARVLVADLVVGDAGGRRVSDAWGLVRGAWRRGRLAEAWRRLFAMRRSSYAATRKRLGLLAVDPESLVAVARSAGAHARVLCEPLTMLANRRHLFVQTTT